MDKTICKQCLNIFVPATWNQIFCTSKCRNEYNRDITLMVQEARGAKCSICGYDKCKSAIVFHHIDPTKKAFVIFEARQHTKEAVMAELDKCIPVCHNCHAEIHAGLIDVK